MPVETPEYDDEEEDEDIFSYPDETMPSSSLVKEQESDSDSSPEWPDEDAPVTVGYDVSHNNPLHQAIVSGSKEGIRAHIRNRKMVNEKNAMG